MAYKIITTSIIHRNERFSEVIGLFDKRTTTGSLSERVFTAKDTNLSSRVINHWDKSKLLPDGVKDVSGWRKFSFPEIVWLNLANRLRDFGFSLSKIAKIKKQLMVFNKKNDTYPILDLYIGEAWFTQNDSYVIVLADGTADIGSFLEIELSKNTVPKKQKDMLLISLKSIVNELGLTVQKATIPLPIDDNELAALDVFSKDKRMQRLFEGIAAGSVQQVQMTSKDKKVNKVEVTRSYQNPERAIEKIRAMLKDGKRKRISLEVQDEKVIAIEEIEKT